MNERKPDERAHLVRDWWNRVCSSANGSARDRARLRRCRHPNDALSVPAAVLLPQMLGSARVGAPTPLFDRDLNLARLLAFVEQDGPFHPMRKVGWETVPKIGRANDNRESSKPPILSEVRFRRLVQADPGEDLVTQFRRLVQLFKEPAVDIGELAAGFRYWHHPNGFAKQRWTFQYYNISSAAPASSPSEAVSA